MFGLDNPQQIRYYHLCKEHMYQNNNEQKKNAPNTKYKIAKKLFSINKKKSFDLIILIPVIISVNGIK